MSYPNNKLSTDDNCCFACFGENRGGLACKLPPTHTHMGFRGKSPKVPRLAQQPEKQPPPPLENSTYIYKPKPNRKNPAATALLERVKCFLCILLCVVLPAFCWRCCCSFRSCHLLCPCVCVCVCVLCNKCASLLLYNDVTKSTHKRQPRRHQCRSSMFWSCSPAPSTFNPPSPRTCVCLCFGALSVVKVWAFSPPEKTNHLNTLSWSFIGGIVHISRVLCQVFHHNLSTESSCASFPLAGFPFWLLGFFVGPLNVCRLLCKLPPKWLLWFGSSQRKF